MLLLKRTIGETIIIDGGIEITVTDIQGKHAKICINAPKATKILSKELKKDTYSYTAPPYG